MKFKKYVITFLLFSSIVVPAQDGTLDKTFSNDGIVITPLGDGNDIGYSVAVQSDNKIVVAGASQDSTGQYDFAVVRYNDDGSLDATFNTDGITTTDIKGKGATDYSYSVAIQKDDKIVAAGWTYGYSDPYDDYAVVRYNSNGTLDSSFGTGGIVTTNIGKNDKGKAVAIQDDGKIVVAGYTGNETYDFSIVRYDTNGVLDNSFNSNGKITTDIASGNDYGLALAIQHDNKIIVAGVAKEGSENKLALVRYDSNGSLDGTFGFVLTPIGFGVVSNGASVVVQPDGKIVVSCTYWGGDNGEYLKIAVVRYTSNGSPDNEWGINGIVQTSISDADDEAYSIGIQSDGKILVGGYSTSSLGHDFTIIRYNSDGSLDSEFNSDGIITTHLTAEWSYDDAYGMILKNDKIILCGRTDNGDNFDFAVTRYNNDGTVQVESNPFATQNMRFELLQNYPNPFGGAIPSGNPSTTIKYSMPTIVGTGQANVERNAVSLKNSEQFGESLYNVTLKVYDILGRDVATLVNKQQQPGNYKVTFNANGLPSGVYFYQLKTKNFIKTKKMLLLE